MFVDWIEQKFGALVGQVRDILKPKKAQPQTPSETDFSFADEGRQPTQFEPQQPDIVPTKRVDQRWHASFGKDKTIADVWEIAHQQLEIQFDRASFFTYLKDITLVDYDADALTFTLAVKETRNFDMVRHRLHRNIRRVLSDAFGQEVEITYVTYDDWRDRHR